ncbi:Max-binding protein MNT [Papilio machaon]|uniref:Max-binding protein MNT n=1 Tax=Papilio machaon TaxID=76193 RepID=A0A194RER1_PAPMA|nr:Max-binding protein MNT [Papilio machaon]
MTSAESTSLRALFRLALKLCCIECVRERSDRVTRCHVSARAPHHFTPSLISPGCPSPPSDAPTVPQLIMCRPLLCCKRCLSTESITKTDFAQEEPKTPLSVRVVTGVAVTARSNGVVRPTTPVPSIAAPVPVPAPAPAPAVIVSDPPPAPAVIPPAPAVITPVPLHDFVQEHSRARTTSNSHGLPQIPSPPSVSSSGSGSGSSSCAPRAGTREVHNKLEKNRRAHLKECFELLKRQLPATSDDKKTSNLSILGSAIRYIQVLRRKERECEHEMERLAREKIAAQQRLAALRREVSVRTSGARPRNIDGVDEKDAIANDQVLGIPISITSSPPRSAAPMESSPPRTLNLSTKLRALPIQITPTTSQVVRTSYGSRHHNTLTLTTLGPAETNTQNGQVMENGVTNTLSTTLVHPAQIHLPLSQVVVAPAALQLLSAGGGLRVLQAPAVHTNGVVSTENSRITKENGLVSTAPVSTEGGSVVVSGLTPLVMSQSGTHLLQTHTLTHKMVETQVVKGGGSVAPMTVSTQYLSSTTIVKPMVVVSSAHSPPAPST